MRYAYLLLLVALVLIYTPIRLVTMLATRADRWLDRQWRRAWLAFEIGEWV